MLKIPSTTAVASACLSLFSGLALVACGGGSGEAGDPPAATPASTTLTLAGTAAQGAAMAGAAIGIKCASGTASLSAGSDGSYSAALTDASLPCVVRAVSADGKTSYHSLQAGSGAATASYTVNISPLTELLVASVAGAAPDAYYTGFGATTTLSTATVTQAVNGLATLLAGVVDLGGANPIADPLAVGNALDQKIDALNAALTAAHTSLAELTSAVATDPGAGDAVKRLVQPVASSCASLRSGKFRMISPFEQDPPWRAHVLSLNAQTLGVSVFDGSTGTLAADPAHACSFSISDDEGSVQLMVSSAGVIMGFHKGGVPITFGLPEQTLPLSELAGTWNLIRTEALDDGSGKLSMPTEVTVDASGQITAFAECPGSGACTPGSGPFPTIRANAAGGFDVVEGGEVTDRVYLFKTESGSKMLVSLSSDGKAFNVGTPKKATALPTVDASNSFWDFSMTGKLALSAPALQAQRIVSVDAANQRYARIFTAAEGAALDRVDSFSINSPREGWRTRAQGDCTLKGAPVNCLGVFVLPLQGMGITLNTTIGASTAATSRLGFSVNAP
ncbi:hypothetical protein [Roseateles violae]|uniref:Uncharacterized protein n=1 Tax=Roseateles violae TaxID=3058042 RepID=A0ABT8DKE8_9BURK|nr:hypothetical protein [Pelomonas sp. PFR6]MDN3918867.1 hypothetical protein [Pelomonas sp. PFR6]